MPHRVSWRALISYAKFAARGTALFGLTAGARAGWGPTDHLLAALVDIAHIELWAKTKDGRRNANRPAPIVRPGEEQAESVMGDASETVEEIDQWLRDRWNRQHAIEAATTVEAGDVGGN